MRPVEGFLPGCPVCELMKLVDPAVRELERIQRDYLTLDSGRVPEPDRKVVRELSEAAHKYRVHRHLLRPLQPNS